MERKHFFLPLLSYKAESYEIFLQNTKTQLWFYASSITHNKAFSQLLFYIFIAQGWNNNDQQDYKCGRQKLTINLLSPLDWDLGGGNCCYKRWKNFFRNHRTPRFVSTIPSTFNNVLNWQWHKKALKLLKCRFSLELEVSFA